MNQIESALVEALGELTSETKKTVKKSARREKKVPQVTAKATKSVAPKVAAPKSEPSTQIEARFYATETENPRAPVYDVHVYMPAPFKGMVIRASVFAQRDLRGQIKDFSVSLPSGYRNTPIFFAAPLHVIGQDGKEYPTANAKNADGKLIEQKWAPVITDALYRFQRTGNPVQTLNF